jgi:hypothetical protein
MNLIQTVSLETQINEFFLAHDFIVLYVLKEVGTKTQNINTLWYVVMDLFIVFGVCPIEE